MKILRASLINSHSSSLHIPPQLGDRRVGILQSLVWRRSADEGAALSEEGDLPEGGGGGPLPLSCHLPCPGPALPHPGLPARVEYWILVTGAVAFENPGTSITVWFTSPTTIVWISSRWIPGDSRPVGQTLLIMLTIAFVSATKASYTVGPHRHSR